jgi:hypothetical protein
MLAADRAVSFAANLENIRLGPESKNRNEKEKKMVEAPKNFHTLCHGSTVAIQVFLIQKGRERPPRKTIGFLLALVRTPFFASAFSSVECIYSNFNRCSRYFVQLSKDAYQK